MFTKALYNLPLPESSSAPDYGWAVRDALENISAIVERVKATDKIEYMQAYTELIPFGCILDNYEMCKKAVTVLQNQIEEYEKSTPVS